VPGDLSDDELLDRIRADHRAIGVAQAHELIDVGELAHRRAGEAVSELRFKPLPGGAAVSIGARAVAEELAFELVLSSGQGERLAFNSVGFVLEAAQTLDHLERGEIDLPKAEAILDSVRTVIDGTLDADPDGPEPHRLAEGLQEKVLRRASGQTVSNLKRACSKAVIQIDPGAAERRHKVKRERRHIRLVPMDDSMCLLEVYLRRIRRCVRMRF
jgi:hypothetical protein